ncbi:hypothetical protein HDU89_004223 [Geranomyces variabilis]|nr:hypothetical protein HDU89_004223 [Geranomyces variabilis]
MDDTSQSPPPVLSFADRVKGLVFGAALGDAVGLSTEFLTKQQAIHLYGRGPIEFGKQHEILISGEEHSRAYPFHRDSHRCRWQEGDFTDDTDQLIALMQSVTACGGRFSTLDFARRLKGWAEDGLVLPNPDSDHPSTKPPCGIGKTVSLVLGHPGFLTDPHKAAYMVWASHGRRFAPNGAVMRSAVLAAADFRSEHDTVVAAASAAMVTHADPRCVVSCVLVNALVAKILRGETAVAASATTPLSENEQAHLKQFVTREHTQAASPPFTPDPSPSADHTHSAPRQRPRFRMDPAAKARLQALLAGSVDPQQAKPDTEQSLSLAFDRPAAILDPHAPPPVPTCPVKTALIADLVAQYAFLLPSQDAVNDLHVHALAPSLGSLRLDEPSRIGYTFKTLGAAMYAFTRDLSSATSAAEAFKQVITEISLEAGDADTNACVAGALMGCALGFEQLPRDWVAGLRHAKELEVVVDEFLKSLLGRVAEEEKERIH